MIKKWKQVLSLMLCICLCMPVYAHILGSSYVAAAAETIPFLAAQDAYVSNFNGQENSVMVTSNANKLIYGKSRHVYVRFDLSSIDTERYDIDDMDMILSFRKSHAPNELEFTESESFLRESETEWTVNNVTFNNRPNDIVGSPVVTRNISSSGEENVTVDLSTIFQSALSNGRKVVSIHLTTTSVDDSTIGASEMYSSRNSAGQPGPSLNVTLGEPIINDGTDRAALNLLITQADQYIETEYTTESWAEFVGALNHAKEISLRNGTQDEVDGALITLETAMENLEEAERPSNISGPDMGNYFNNGKTAAMIIKLKNSDGEYVKVDPLTEKLSLSANAAEASKFALYVHDYFATVDHEEPEVGATRTVYTIKSLENDKYLTIQNYFSAEQFLSNTHRYYNIMSGAQSGTGVDRTFEVKASATIPNWNERFYVDKYANSGYYRIFSHLSTMRDDVSFNLFHVKMMDDSMQSTGIAAQDTEYDFYFEEATDSNLLEISQEVSGDEAVLFWRPVNGDTDPAHYSVDGTNVSVFLTDGLMRVAVSDLSAGVHRYTVKYNGSGYQATADVDVRIFSHPGILHSAEDLERIKQHVLAKDEPWYSDYKRLLNSTPYQLSSFDYETTVFPNVGRGGAPSDSANMGYFEKGGNAAYFNALQWVITGDEQYAATTIDILNKWADALKVIDGRDRILGAGINAYKYANAAEIIRYYNGGYSRYTDSDFKALQDMMLNVVYPVIQDAGVPMIANGNWDAAAIISMISIGVLSDNTEIFDRAMALYQDIHVNGSIFAYVHESGQTMETGRDQAHALLAIGYMAEICLVAYNQDEDLYSLYDNRLAKAFEYAAKYNLYSKELYDADVPFVAMPNVFGDTSRGYYGAGFDRENNGLNRGELRPVFEQGLALYTKAGSNDMTWTAKAAAAARPQGMVHFDNLNFGTLTLYNGEPLSASQPYFQMRTRWEPLYQRNWSIVDDQRVAETLNSYYDINENGEIVTNVMKNDAPFFQLVANDDGTYSIRVVKTNTYLSVKDETAGSYNLIKADATEVGDNEKFILRSSGVGPYFLASPKFDDRIVYQEAAGSGSSAMLTLRLGTKMLSQVADIPDVTTNERLIFMYNTEEIAVPDNAATVPGMPQNFTAKPGDSQVKLSWITPASNGGAKIVKYEVSKDNGVEWNEADSDSGHTFRGLMNGTAYNFKVRAVNSLGSGEAAVVTAIPVSVPQTVTVPGNTTTDEQTVSLNGSKGNLTKNENGGYHLILAEKQVIEVIGDRNELIIDANDVNDLTVELPLSAMDTAPLTIKTDFGTIFIPNATLQNMRKKYGDTLVLHIWKGSYMIELLQNDKSAAYEDANNPLTVTLPFEATGGHDVYEYVVIKKESSKDVIFPLAILKDDSVTFDITTTGTYDVIYNGRSFLDISKANWAARDIAFVVARGLFEGTGENLFSPNATMTRAMFAKVLADLEGVDLSGYTNSIFTDVRDNQWYTSAVTWAGESGILNGTGQGRFSPNDSITCEQMALMLFNYAVIKGYELSSTAIEFTDGDSVSSWASEAVEAIAAAGILIGKPDGTFDPKTNTTRAEVATVFARFIRGLSEN